MARYAIDARTLLHVLDHELTSSHQLVAPNAIRSDALELLLIDVGHGRRSERDALAVHERVTELKMRVLGDRVSRTMAWRIAREHHWDRLRDAEYLAIAKLQADALVTIDARLAAKAAGVVSVAKLNAVFKRSHPRKRRATPRTSQARS